MLKILCLLFFCLVFSACGIPEEEHNAVLQDLEDTRIELSKFQRLDAENKSKIKELETAVQTAEARIRNVEADYMKLKKEYALAKESLRIFESKAGSLEQRLAATKTELVELRKARAIAEKRAAQYRKLTEKLASMVQSGKLTVKIRNGKMVIQLDNAILFDPGQVKLKKAGREAIAEVATILKDIKNRQFLVAGHTDNVPVKSKRFGSNWALSTARAVEVVTNLQDNGVNPKNMAAAGYGEFDPVASNDTPDNRALNRRIEIILMPNLDELPAMPKNITGS